MSDQLAQHVGWVCLCDVDADRKRLVNMWVGYVCQVMLMLVAQGLTGRDLRRQPFLTFAVGVRAGLSHGKPT